MILNGLGAIYLLFGVLGIILFFSPQFSLISFLFFFLLLFSFYFLLSHFALYSIVSIYRHGDYRLIEGAEQFLFFFLYISGRLMD